MSLLKKKSQSNTNLLEINRVTKSFGGLKAVNNCSFNIKKGSITGLIGPNGAGKTTLFNVITGQLPADEGSIKIDGEEITELPSYKTFNKGIVRTFQIPRELKRMTVLENLMVIKSNQSGENLFTTWFNPWKVKREEIDNLNKELASTNQQLATVTEEKDSISFFGALINKPAYKGIMWGIVAILALILGFFVYKFKNANTVTQEAQKSLAELEEEYEEHRRKALEREQKARRQLQDEINKQKLTKTK